MACRDMGKAKAAVAKIVEERVSVYNGDYFGEFQTY